MIFAFSGTGNSYSAARRLSEALGVGMVDIAKAVAYGRYRYDAEGEAVGFVFPTYFRGLPAKVLEFARGVSVADAGRTFSVATCGEESGGACDMLAEALGGRLGIDACYDVVMPDNAVFMSDAPSPEQAARVLSAADSEIDSIASSVLAGERGDLRRHAGGGDWRAVHRGYGDSRSTEPFRLNDRCIECRMCQEFCPDGIIRFYHRRPVWDEPECSMCMACVQMCPKRAIEYGEGTASRGRYYNPVFYERTIGIPPRYRRIDTTK